MSKFYSIGNKCVMQKRVGVDTTSPLIAGGLMKRLNFCFRINKWTTLNNIIAGFSTEAQATQVIHHHHHYLHRHRRSRHHHHQQQQQHQHHYHHHHNQHHHQSHP